MPESPYLIVGIVIVAIFLLIFFGIFVSFWSTWLKARLNGASVTISSLVGMRLGGVPYNLVVDARITGVKAGIPLVLDKIAAFHFQLSSLGVAGRTTIVAFMYGCSSQK